jgi:diguanylate cyclase (GGDEF)-like protein
MTSRLVDLNATDSRRSRSTSLGERSPSYVLVADTNPVRIAECLTSIRPLKIEAIVARDGREAIAVLERRGTPSLLILDLSLPCDDGVEEGLAIVDAIASADRGRVAMIAWASRRDLREFAVHRLAGLKARVLGGTAAPSVVHNAIESALDNSPRPLVDAGPSATEADVHDTMAALSERAHRLCGTAGVAVYLRGSDDAQFRTSVTWLSDAPIPQSPDFLPSVFDAVLATGESFFRTDVTMQPLSKVTAGVVRGLGAVPLVDLHGQTVGAMCVFDLNPVAFSTGITDALKELGRGISVRGVAEPAAVVSAGATVLPPVPRPAEAVPRPAEPVRRQAESPARPLSPIPVVLLDRNAGSVAVARELARLRRERRHLSVVLFDVDAVNGADQDAEFASDLVRNVSDTLTKAIRGSDLAIRWTTDALLVVLPGLGLAEARPVAERIRAALAAGTSHRLAVAGGVAELLSDETFDSVVARADDRVRMARERGHNRVVA